MRQNLQQLSETDLRKIRLFVFGLIFLVVVTLSVSTCTRNGGLMATYNALIGQKRTLDTVARQTILQTQATEKTAENTDSLKLMVKRLVADTVAKINQLSEVQSASKDARIKQMELNERNYHRTSALYEKAYVRTSGQLDTMSQTLGKVVKAVSGIDARIDRLEKAVQDSTDFRNKVMAGTRDSILSSVSRQLKGVVSKQDLEAALKPKQDYPVRKKTNSVRALKRQKQNIKKMQRRNQRRRERNGHE